MPKYYLLKITFLLICSLSGLQAQRKDPDSLQVRFDYLRRQPGFKETDTAYINTLYAISYGIGREDLDSARVLAKKTILLSRESSYPKGIMMGTYSLAIVRLLEGKQAAAIVLADQVQQGADSLQIDGFLLRALNTKGIAYRSLNQPDSSYLNYYKAIQIAQRAKTQKHLYALNLNIGLLFLNTLNYNEALIYYRRAQRYIDSYRNPQYQLNFNLKMAELFLNQKKLDSAWVYLEKTKASLDHGIGYAREQSAYWNSMGEFHLKKQEWEKAKSLYRKTISTQKNTQEPNLITAFLGIARSEYELQNYSSALAFNRKVKELNKRQNLASKTDGSYKLQAKIFNALGDRDSAQIYLNIYQRKYDSLRRKINANSLALLHAHQNEIERIEKQKLAEVETAKERKLLGVFWLLMGITALVLAIIFYRGYRNYKEKVHALDRITKEKDQLFTILGHDLRSPLSTLQELLSLYEEPNGDKQFLKDQLFSLQRRIFYSKETLNNMIRWVQDQLADAKPVKVDVLIEDIIPGCIESVYELARKKNISISFSPEPDISIRVDPIHFEIVLNNLLLNAIKFSESGQSIQVQWSSEDQNGILFIRDHGIGMSKEQIDQFNHRGVIKQRKGTSGESGLGVGLNICSKLMQLNGARLELQKQEPGTQANLIFKTN